MKELLMGVIVGMVSGIAIGMSDCGKDLACKAKGKIKQVCSCAEKEINRLEKNIDDKSTQDDNGQKNNNQ